jgi:hypothetical protein
MALSGDVRRRRPRHTDFTPPLQEIAMTAPSTLPQTLAAQPTALRPARYDIYQHIHKALRKTMCETLVQLGRADSNDAAELADALRAVEGLCATLRDHLAHENDHLHPALEAAEHGASDRVVHQHDQHLIDIAAREHEVRSLRALAAPARPAAMLQLYRHLALFVAENLEHMHIEETAHNAVLWAAYDDAEIAAIEGRILDGMSPEACIASLQDIARAVSPQSLIGLLSGIQRQAPAPAFVAVLSALQPTQPPARWAFVLQSLMCAEAVQ